MCIWGAGGATPGKFLIGLRVVTCDSSVLVQPNRVLVVPATNVSLSAWVAVVSDQKQTSRSLTSHIVTTVSVSPDRSTVRALNKNFSIAFFFPAFITLLFFQHNRTVYDMVAGTIVVKRSRARWCGRADKIVLQYCWAGTVWCFLKNASRSPHTPSFQGTVCTHRSVRMLAERWIHISMNFLTSLQLGFGLSLTHTVFLQLCLHAAFRIWSCAKFMSPLKTGKMMVYATFSLTQDLPLFKHSSKLRVNV